jgi:hypothetical protein
MPCVPFEAARVHEARRRSITLSTSAMVGIDLALQQETKLKFRKRIHPALL